jgi:hypothetical protein
LIEVTPGFLDTADHVQLQAVNYEALKPGPKSWLRMALESGISLKTHAPGFVEDSDLSEGSGLPRRAR